MTEKKPDVLRDLAQMMATFDFHQSRKVSYSQIERFLKKSFKSGPMIIFSLPIDQSSIANKKDFNMIRFLWNKRSIGGHYKKDIINQIIRNLLDSDLEETSYIREKILDENFIVFKMGELKGQAIYGLYLEKTIIDGDYLNLFSVFMNNVSKGWTLLDELRMVENLIHVDDVTGLYNQRKMLKDLDTAVLRYKELKEEFCVLFIDIDHFKKVNDGHGHLVGTSLLHSMGKLLKDTLRESDLIYRYGGDEFVMLVPDVDESIGRIIGERVLHAIKKEVFEVKSQNKKENIDEFKLGVSIGVANFPKDATTKEDILSIADRMMYEAKQGGRGRVCFTSELLKKS